MSQSNIAERGAALHQRIEKHVSNGVVALQSVFGTDCHDVADRATAIVLESALKRSEALWRRDLTQPSSWFCQPETIGYVCYVDRFSRTLDGIHERLDYLQELGITYLHLMPILEPRLGESDGGYAVKSYDEIDPRIGTMDDLEALTIELHKRGMSLCADLVLNHTAKEHSWAIAASKGDEHYRAYYHIFPNRDLPNRYEESLREIFPDFAPGSFSPLGSEWVWTTFNDFQWDLNYSNPDVFCEMLAVMCRLANRGVDVLRLDAVPFLWKKLGTDCENHIEAHQLLTAFRAFMEIAAPSLVFKAEAIVSPELLVPYLGVGEPPRHECDIAYNNQLMVLLWSSLATRDAQLMSNALGKMPPLPHGTAWVTYVRCHDDIGWAITDDNALSVGWDGWSHRRFLSSFYSGEFDGSYACGELFQVNPATGDSRISGSAASLCGIEKAAASGDVVALGSAIARLELAYAVVYAFGGIPLLYMGDELGMTNDHSYLWHDDLRADNRWMHRPMMNWIDASHRTAAGSSSHALFAIFKELASSRRSLPALDARVETRINDSGDTRVFSLSRHDGESELFAMVANFSEVSIELFDVKAASKLSVIRSSSGAIAENGTVTLPPLSYLWLG